MKPEELRIGNIVELFLRPYTITQHDFVQDIHDDCHIASLNQMPLTMEWLEYFGFYHYLGMQNKLYIDYGMDKLNTLNFEIHRPKTIFTNSEAFIYPISGSYCVEVNYVHELQNLFHAISGEELKRKQI